MPSRTNILQAYEKRKKTERWEAEQEERRRRNSLPLVDNLRLLLQSPITKLPVAIDYPRLAHKIHVYDGDTDLTPDTDDEIDQEGSALDVPRVNSSVVDMHRKLCAMLRLTSENYEHEIGKLSEGFKQWFILDPTTEHQVLDKRLQLFLENTLDETSGIANILKVCNQAAIAPAVLQLKRDVGLKLPYRDMRGAWTIDVSKYNEKVIVKHKKTEQSCGWALGGQNHEYGGFVFSWEVDYTFSSHADVLEAVDLRVCEVTFMDNTSQENKERVLSVFEAYYDPT